RVEVLAGGPGGLPDPAYLPAPVPVTLPGEDGREVHAFLYPPAHPDHVVTEPHPYVIFVHGGPTAHATTALDLGKAFLTSRGIGVLDVNYGGSTGYGRAYRDLLKGQWGVTDVADVVAAARWLAAEGHADPGRIAVRGGSAGGWTVMAACCRSDLFAGGVSYCGVSALAPPNANRSRWPAASPARCCCSRGSTTRWCRRSSRPPSPRRCRSAACPAPIWPSRAKGTASAAPRPAPPRSPPNSLSTSRSSCDGSA